MRSRAFEKMIEMTKKEEGIFKVEWIYRHEMYYDYRAAFYGISNMIDFYNNRRPHMSIGNKTPMDVYRGEVPGPNLWKKSIESCNYESNALSLQSQKTSD